MCGHVGIILNGSSGGFAKDADMYEQLLYIDALRGDDGTGSVLYSNDGSIDILKECSPAEYFLSTQEMKQLRNQFIAKGKAWLGHNRKMTIGKVADETTHPFVIDNNVVFMHNGTLHNHKELADTEVDSQALGQHLAKCKGDPREIEKALGEVRGAYACAWIDQEKEMLYLLRNKERPLYLAKFNGGWMYCSEPGFMIAVASRNGMKLDNMEEVKEHTLYSFNLKENTYQVQKDELTVPKKSTASTHTTATGTGRDTKPARTKITKGYGKDSLVEFEEVATKNSYKRFRNKFLGKTVSFWITDYLDLVLHERKNKQRKSTFRIWAQSDLVTAEHEIIFKMDDCSEYDIETFYGEFELCGTIESVNWNPNKKMFEIHVNNVDLNPDAITASRPQKAANEETTATVH